jgi:arginine/ornithine N-succinyltransferase beta subunit
VLILRPIAEGDLEALVSLAQLLDSVNLPSERDFLADRIAASMRSFSGRFDHWHEGVYVFNQSCAYRGRHPRLPVRSAFARPRCA